MARSKARSKPASKKATTKKRSSTRRSAPAVAGFSRKDEREFQARSDLDTLRRAQDIQGDPNRLKAAQTMADKEMAALRKVSGRKR